MKLQNSSKSVIITKNKSKRKKIILIAKDFIVPRQKFRKNSLSIFMFKMWK